MSETEISEIESLVSVIGSEEVRNETRLQLYIQLVHDKKGNVKFPEQHVDEMIDVCLRKSDELKGKYEDDEQGALLTYAARVAKHAGRTEQARQLYERAIAFNDEKELTIVAAKVAVEAGMEDKSRECYEKIILYFEEERNFNGAAQVADEAKMSERAEAYRVLEERLKLIKR